jgi:hypothetical protein
VAARGERPGALHAPAGSSSRPRTRCLRPARHRPNRSSRPPQLTPFACERPVMYSQRGKHPLTDERHPRAARRSDRPICRVLPIHNLALRGRLRALRQPKETRASRLGARSGFVSAIVMEVPNRQSRDLSKSPATSGGAQIAGSALRVTDGCLVVLCGTGHAASSERPIRRSHQWAPM